MISSVLKFASKTAWQATWLAVASVQHLSVQVGSYSRYPYLGKLRGLFAYHMACFDILQADKLNIEEYVMTCL